MVSSYKPSRQNDDSGLQVFGLQQQRCQVGVLAEEKNLLCLEDRDDGSQMGTMKNTAEQNTTEQIIGHTSLAQTA